MNGRFWLILLVVSLLLSGVGCKKRVEERPEEAPEVKVEEKATVKEMKPTRMNDDLWVELKAQEAFIIGKYVEKVEAGEMGIEAGIATSREFEKVLKKYGITEDEFNDYTAEMDETRVVMELMPRVFQRAEELKGH